MLIQQILAFHCHEESHFVNKSKSVHNENTSLYKGMHIEISTNTIPYTQIFEFLKEFILFYAFVSRPDSVLEHANCYSKIFAWLVQYDMLFAKWIKRNSHSTRGFVKLTP
ncbi:hypothetical protein QQG55_24845 [Brugia pahangi]